MIGRRGGRALDSPMPEARIVPLSRDDEPEAARVLARAFVDNPLHVAAFGASNLTKNEAFFRVGLSTMRGPKHAAIDGERMVGVVHWVDSTACQLSPIRKLALVPAMLRGLGPASSARLMSWLGAWSRRDPPALHVHFGPIGVVPEARGRHLGRRLLELYCAELDRAGAAGHLETDRPENVQLYRRFGFETTVTVPVLGVPNFFMRREHRERTASP